MIDVIVPVYKPDKRFYDLISMLKRQKIQAKHYIFINTERRFWKEEFLQGIENAEVYHITKEEFDHGKTRRMGAELSTSPIMIFMTQDAVPADEMVFTHLVDSFSDPQVAVSYARQLPNRDCKMIERFTRGFNYPKESRIKTKKDLEEMGIKTYFCSNVCAAYRKEDYIKLGGFVEKTIFNEDMLFAAKAIEAGKAVAYVAEAKVYHSHNEKVLPLFQRNFDLAVSQQQYKAVFEGISSEAEGIKLVKKKVTHLLREKKWYLIPKLVINSGAKYLGYQMGKHYERLPQKVVLCCTSNREYWRNYGKNTRRI